MGCPSYKIPLLGDPFIRHDMFKRELRDLLAHIWTLHRGGRILDLSGPLEPMALVYPPDNYMPLIAELVQWLIELEDFNA